MRTLRRGVRHAAPDPRPPSTPSAREEFGIRPHRPLDRRCRRGSSFLGAGLVVTTNPNQSGLNLLECARTERTPRVEAFAVTRRCPDCIAPPAHGRLHSRHALTPVRETTQDLAGGTIPSFPCRYRHKAGCSERECHRSLPACLRLPRLHAT